jgi:FkbM family methyltransferase
VQSLKQFLVYAQNRLVLILVTLGFRHKTENFKLIRLGTDYGGWWVPEHLLKTKNRTKMLVSVGLGFDVSFDKKMFAHDFSIIGLDPLGDSIKYAQSILGEDSQVKFLNCGLWSSTGVGTFFSPQNQTHDSWSIQNLQNTDVNRSKKFPVISLKDLLQKFPEIEKSDFSYLKMDIEGAEIRVLDDVAKSQFKFDVIAAEMDFLSLIGFKNIWQRILMIHRARNLLEAIEKGGYQLIYNENFNFFWIVQK